MKIKLLLSFLVVCLTLPAFAEEPKADDPMMKAWMEFATPAEPHKAMQNMVGTWETTMKSYMDPANPTEQKGTSTYVSLMDGRYVQETATGNFMGMPFQGMGVFGYDNLMKKYVGSWIDNMGTGIMTSVGTSEDGGKTINFTGTSSDPVTGKQQTYHSTMKMLSADQYHFEMSGPGPDGKEAKMMEITYTRKK